MQSSAVGRSATRLYVPGEGGMCVVRYFWTIIVHNNNIMWTEKLYRTSLRYDIKQALGSNITSLNSQEKIQKPVHQIIKDSHLRA